MKKLIFCFLSLITMMLTTSVFAQISITASTPGATIEEQLIVTPYASPNLTITETHLTLGCCDFRVGLHTPLNHFQGTAYGYANPLNDNFVRLGSSSHRYSYIYVNGASTPIVTMPSNASSQTNLRDIGICSHALLQLNPIRFDYRTGSAPGSTMLNNRVGFSALELQTVFPDLVVYSEEDSLYSIDYISFVPYLVKAFQEEHENVEMLRKENETLRNQVEDLQEMVNLLWGKANEGNDVPKDNNGTNTNATQTKTSPRNRLFQNTPNPFSETTVIRYSLNEPASKAFIQVRDMQGKIVYSQKLSNNASDQVEISTGSLTPGIYTYSLTVDGKVIDSKKMVIAE